MADEKPVGEDDPGADALEIDEEAELAGADADLPDAVREALEREGFVEAAPALDAALEDLVLRYDTDPEFRAQIEERYAAA